MDENEIKTTIESKISMINELRQHITRAQDLNVNVSEDRIKGTQTIINENKEEGLKLLKKANKNEAPFLEILNNGFKKTKEYLFESKTWILIKTENEELKNKFEEFLNIIKFFEEDLKQNIRRYEFEKEYLQSERHIHEYLQEWTKEVQSKRKLINLIKTKKETITYFKDMRENARTALRKGYGTQNFYETIQIKLDIKNQDEFMKYFSYTTLLNSISDMIETYLEFETKMENKNIETLKEVGIKI